MCVCKREKERERARDEVNVPSTRMVVEKTPHYTLRPMETHISNATLCVEWYTTYVWHFNINAVYSLYSVHFFLFAHCVCESVRYHVRRRSTTNSSRVRDSYYLSAFCRTIFTRYITHHNPTIIHCLKPNIVIFCRYLFAQLDRANVSKQINNKSSILKRFALASSPKSIH